jgi:hypothetical protein
MIRFAKIILSAGLNGLALGLLALPATAAQPAVLPSHLPLYFEAIGSQVKGPEQFIARGHDYQFLISATGTQMALRKTATEPVAVRMQFVGANAQAQIRGDAELPGKINYFTGSDPAQWRVGLAMFAQVRVGELYPGVNLVYYGNERLLEYDFTIAPGGNPQAIAMHFDGVDAISVNSQGELILSLAGGEIRQPKPVIYQTTGGTRKEIAGGYRLVDAHTVAFAVGKYDRSQPLVLDPVLGYSTYFGGTAGDTAWAVAVDTNGSIYITGQTFSRQLFTNGWNGGPSFSTFGAFQTNFNGGKLTGDAFVAKLSIASDNTTTADYLTYLGGSADDGALGVAVDAAGNAYVTGFTDSPDFPVTNSLPGGVPGLPNSTNISGILDKSFGYYPIDAFVTELDSSGSNLVYSTYLGGSSMDCGMGIAVDAAGYAYVTGYTYSSNFPTVNALQNKLVCTNSFFFNANAFIAIIGPGGSSLAYSTYFGGTNFDEGKGIAVDTNGFVYVTGFTASTNFPTTNAVVQQLVWTNVVGTNHISITNSLNGYLLNGSTKKTAEFDAFVAKFDFTGTNLVKVYSTLLGSTNNDIANGIAVDNNGAAYVTGWTVSSNFPNTFGANIHSFVATNTRPSDLATNVFLTKITNAIGTTNVGIAWSAVFGGKGADVGYGVALDPAGDEVFVTGSASSTNFPTFNVPGLLRTTNSGKSDAFVIAFNTTGPSLLFSAYLGGKDNDFGYGIAVDTMTNVYVVGQTLSTNFPTFNGAITFRNGTNDAFLTKIILNVVPPAITTNAQPTSQTNAVGSFLILSVSGGVTGTPPFFYQWQFGTNLVVVTNVVDATNLIVVTNLVDATNLVNGTNISGVTNDTLIINPAQTTNAGYYQVIVTNFAGSVTSAIAVLGVTNIPAAVTVQPTNQLVGVGTTAILTATATGTAPLRYQWQVNGTNLVNGGHISGATSNVLAISNVQLANSSSNYTVIVTNINNSATSSVAILQVQASPVITVQPTPTNQSMAVGSTATFAVTAVGTVPLHYQWQYGTNLVNWTNLVNGVHISGATTNVLTISTAQMTNSGFYSVIVMNIAGSVTSSIVDLTVTNIPPAITVQPTTNQLVGVGTTATLAVIATGTAPLSYQWQVNGTNLMNGHANGATISGTTNNVLTISNVQTNNSSTNYTVVVTNFAGSVTSSVAALTVQAAPLITMQPTPTNQSIAVGSNATFTVTAVGTVPLHYQWQKDGANLTNAAGHISGATTNVLTINNAQTTDSSTNYTVIVTNIAGSVTSSVATLTVTNVPPAITVQPTNQAVVVGTSVTLAVTATGTAPLRYQWQVNGTNLVNSSGQISGAINNVLKINRAQTTNSGNYMVIVTNLGGSVTSSVAILTVASSPVIITQPTNQGVAVGSNATFAVTAVGFAPLSYQWWVNGTNLLVNGSQTNGATISGVTNNVLTISNAQTNDSGNYYSVTVTNSSGSMTSSNALLTVTNIPPAILVPPTNQTVGVGSTVTNVVIATGTPPLSYQWQVNGTNLVDGGRFSGATTNLLTITNAQTSDSGSYSVTVMGPGGSVTSSNAVLTVIVPLPDFGKIIAAGDGSFILSGTGGGANGTYYVLTSSNLLIPLTNWMYIATNQFDGSGNFIFTNAAPTNAPQWFYILQLP